MYYKAKEPEQGIRERIKSWFTRRYKIKIAVLVLVFILWLVLAGQQNFEKKIDLVINYKNIPENLVESVPVTQIITIIFRGLRKDVSLLNANNINSFVDLFSARSEIYFYNINTGNINLPNDRIHLVNINPSKIKLTKKKLKS